MMKYSALNIKKKIDYLFKLPIFFFAKFNSNSSSTLLPKRILVIKLSAMGDALCLMPSIRMLKDRFPDAEIDWLTTHRANPNLFSSLPFLNKIILLPFNFSLPFFLFRLFKVKYDICIDYDQSYLLSELISNFSKVNVGFSNLKKGSSFKVKINYDLIANEKLIFCELTKVAIRFFCYKDNFHYQFQLYELLNSFQPSNKLLEFSDRVNNNARPLVVIYPGSSPNAIYRRWPIDRYLKLTKLLSTDCQIVIAGGPDEIQLKSTIQKFGLSQFDHINHWSLTEWAWIFKNLATLFVGNDAGLLHLAESQNLPIIGIFGPNIHTKWGSLNKFSSSLYVDIECRPCIHGHLGIVPAFCARRDVACLDISVETVKSFILNNQCISVPRFKSTS